MTESTEDTVANLANNSQHPNNAVSLVKEKTVVLQIPSSESIRTKVALQDQKELNGVTTPLESTLARARLDNSNSIVAFIPDEVLSEIFVHCLPSSQSNYLKDRPPVPSVQSAPLLLTRVCRRWAEVSMSTHRLWAGMTLTHKFCDGNYDQIIKVTGEWIRRSGACPLSFDFQCNEDEGAINKLVQIIIPHAHRWQRIVGLLPRSVLAQILSKISDGVPLLEVLDVSEDRGLKFFDDEPIRESSSRTVDVSCAPWLKKFRSITKDNIMLVFNGSILNNLRTIEVGRATYGTTTFEDLWTCFKHCPNLQSSKFFVSSVGRQNFGPGVLQVAALEICHISTYADPGPLLDHITLPALQYLLLSFSRAATAGQIAPPTHLSWHHLDNLLERSRPPLRQLILSRFHTRMSEQILVSCLRRATDLRQLEITFSEITDYFIHMMTNESQFECNDSPDPCCYLCPCLEELYIEQTGGFTADATVNMVLTRWDKSRLERLYLDCCEFEGRSLTESDPAIRKCLKDGMTINIF